MRLKENLNETDLDKLDPNSLMDRVLLCIKDAINTTFPLKKVSRKEAKKLQNPWMTKEILDEQKKRDALKKGGSNLATLAIHLNILHIKLLETE